jgi:preprotein translocase subunit SecD
MKSIILLLIPVIFSVNLYSQENQLRTGFYSVVEKDSCLESNNYIKVYDSGKEMCIDKIPIITDDNFESVNITADTTNNGINYTVGIKLDSSGAEIIKEVTGKMIGQKTAFIIDNKIVAAPTIRDRIDSGHIAIFCDEKTISEVKKALGLK